MEIESMQKNIGDLQQRLSEVTSPTTKNGPSVPSVSLIRFSVRMSKEVRISAFVLVRVKTSLKPEENV